MVVARNRLITKRIEQFPDSSSAAIDFKCEALDVNAITSDSVWRVSREVRVNSRRIETLFAGAGLFDQICDNREALFPAPPFINALSTRFSAGNEFARVSVDPLLQFDKDDAFSIVGRMKFASFVGNQTLVSSVDPGATARGLEVLQPANTRKIRFNLIANVAVTDLLIVETTSPVLTLDKWHSVICTTNGNGLGSGMTIYIDGLSVPLTISFAGPLVGSTISTQDFFIGSRPAIINNMNGNLDEIAVMGFELTAADALEIHNVGVDRDLTERTFADPNAWWSMGDGSTFNIINDVIGTLDATMVNMNENDFELDVSP